MSSTISDHQHLKCTSMEFASDTITGERDSSHLMEATEPMEISSAFPSTLPTKGKAESDPAEEIPDENEESGDESEEIGDEIEESGDENEESGDENEERGEEVNEYSNSKWEFNPEWDVDSFENLTFDEEREEKRTEHIDKEDVEDWLRFKRQHIENKGFYVDEELWPMYSYTNYRVIKDLESPTGVGQTHLEFFQELACLCVQRFNEDHKEEEEKEKEKDEDFIHLEFVRVVGGVIRLGYAPKSHITFMAREKPDGPDVEYQAKVWSDVVKGNDPDYNCFKHYPILCRPAPPPKTSN